MTGLGIRGVRAAPAPYPEPTAEEDAASLADIGRGAVDELDVAAELESKGVTDHGCRYHLDEGLFEVAERVYSSARGETVWEEPRTTLGWPDVREQIWRAVVLLCGVVLAALVIVALEVPAPAIAASTCAAWIGGHIVGSIVWAHRGRGDLAGGRRAAVRWAVGFVTVTAAVALLAGLVWPSVGQRADWICYEIGLQVYAVLFAIGSAADLVRRCATVVVLGAAAGLAVWFAGSLDLLGWVGFATVCALALAVSSGRQSAPRLPVRRWADLRVAVPAFFQAAFLATTLVVLAVTTSTGFRAMTIAAVALGVALAEPLLTLVRWRLQHRAAVFVDAVFLRPWLSAGSLLACAAPTALLTVAVSAVRSGDLHVGAPIVALGCYGALAGASSVPRVLGRSGWAVIFAIPPIVPVLLVEWGSAWVIAASVVVATLELPAVVQRVRDPRSYL